MISDNTGEDGNQDGNQGRRYGLAANTEKKGEGWTRGLCIFIGCIGQGRECRAHDSVAAKNAELLNELKTTHEDVEARKFWKRQVISFS